uniref:Leucine rich repeat containing 43 n=1 Tax=Malurus cyaneus samueli TaxID=2593467 RepID=A0A8C5UHQ1_9PASS
MSLFIEDGIGHCQSPSRSPRWAQPGRTGISPGTFSAAFQEYLRYLALQDFPCSLGSWNKSHHHARRSLEEAVPLGEESPEARLDLLRDGHSPWALPPDCSPQDRLLREVAVLAPEFLRDTLAKPSSLQVEEVDEGLLRFQQLEELFLSANQISRVSSAHLPRTLKVLVLSCNAVSDLQDLCVQPPPGLQHLGLGYNQLCGPSQEKHLTVDFWPNLISLDLSFNSLTDLLELVSQLSTLPKLRILVLQGNPLALLPAYRGFLVDSLPKLSYLDGIQIWPDERLRFHGLANQPELMSEARVVVSIGEMKGLPDPKAFQQQEVDSEGPEITFSYYVTYEFVEAEELKNGGSPEVGASLSMLDVDSSAQDTGEIRNHQEPLCPGSPSVLGKERSPLSFVCIYTAKVLSTPEQPWAPTIDWSYQKEYIVKDLVQLKSCLEAGTVVSVVEEKVRAWDPNPLQRSVPASKDKQKNRKRQQRDSGDFRGDPPILNVRRDPPIRNILGTRRVALETLLATEDTVTALCDFGILIPEKPPEPPALEEKEEKEEKVRSMSQGFSKCWGSANALAGLGIHPCIHLSVLLSPK